MFRVIICISLLSVAKLGPLHQTASTCGYNSCHAGIPDFINVHLVCHTHDDVGWLKTIDEYYYGDKDDIQKAGVQYILDSVVSELQQNPDRKFIYVESSFFWRWWSNRDENIHQQVRALVQSGQLEFAGGGWSMSDEAGNHYSELIDEHTLGFRFLNDTFGPCATPRVGWQIDPFGHSRETASIFAQFGFDGMFVGRVDSQDMAERKKTKKLEMIWHGSENIGVDADLFTGILPNMYQPPSTFCFDITCTDEPIKDDLKMKGYNVNERVDDFISAVESQATLYATKNLIMTMGSDFHYQAAAKWFVNLDKLIKYVNQRQLNGSRINLIYSTPSCYLKSLNDAGISWNVKSDDFFPYSSNPGNYWTGYFTSRPAFKGYTKFTNNVLQIGKQISVYANLMNKNNAKIDWLRRYQGDAQHHDAITGTAKQAVNDDYTQSLYNGVLLTQEAINSAYASLLPLQQSVAPIQEFCHYLNLSSCSITEKNNNFTVIVYNALAQSYISHIRVPVDSSLYSEYRVTDANGYAAKSQLVPLPEQVLDHPEYFGNAKYDLVFQVALQPCGFTTYFVTKSSVPLGKNLPKVPSENRISLRDDNNVNDLVIQNKLVSVRVDRKSGLLTSITDLITRKTFKVSQNFLEYQDSGGAYSFSPGQSAAPVSRVVKAILITGKVVQEIQQTFNEYVSQVIRVYPGEPGVEFEWFVGPIELTDYVGKDVISRYTTDFVTDGIFYTDANGREVIQRKRNFRPTWNLTTTDPISQNYYPVNSRIYIEDKNRNLQLTVVTDRSEGGSSLEDGEVELLVHRRLTRDDNFGLNEVLDEMGPDSKGLRVRGKHHIFVSSIDAGAKLHRVAALKSTQPPMPSFAPLIFSIANYRKHFRTTYSGLTAALPDNVKLLTLEPWIGGTALLRLEHFYERKDDPAGLSQPVTVDIKNMFSSLTITSARETTLGANTWLSNKKRMTWKTKGDTRTSNDPLKSEDKFNAPALYVTLNPMEIKTFVITVAYE